MARYSVTVWASFETEVEAETQEEAEEKAINESCFPYADYLRNRKTGGRGRWLKNRGCPNRT